MLIESIIWILRRQLLILLGVNMEEILNMKDKHIFHGSLCFFKIYKPKQAHCDTHAKENELNAIYGSDDTNFACLCI